MIHNSAFENNKKLHEYPDLYVCFFVSNSAMFRLIVKIWVTSTWNNILMQNIYVNSVKNVCKTNSVQLIFYFMSFYTCCKNLCSCTSLSFLITLIFITRISMINEKFLRYIPQGILSVL